jgi:predicted MPP superfamily phosphohydrolase
VIALVPTPGRTRQEVMMKPLPTMERNLMLLRPSNTACCSSLQFDIARALQGEDEQSQSTLLTHRPD